MKYAHYDKTTRQLLGWYDDGIHTKIPVPNVEISDEVWKEAINNNHNKINDDGTTGIFDFRTAEEIALQEKSERKAEIERQLLTLTVTSSNGNTFDANSQARQNMADAIIASDTLGITQTVWRMADNSEVLINISELREAHSLAIKRYAEIKGIGV